MRTLAVNCRCECGLPVACGEVERDRTALVCELERENTTLRDRVAALESALMKIADYRDGTLAVGFVDVKDRFMAVKDYARAALSGAAQPRGEGARCAVCGGDGKCHHLPDCERPCRECGGAGVVETIDYVEGTPCQSGEPCPACQPAPPASGAPCRECGGDGKCHHLPDCERPCHKCAGSGKHGTGGA